jgi:hypothetical protein
MKTAISLPDRVFQQAERYARRAGKSRSRIYAEAMAEYLVRHAPDGVTERMDEVCGKLGPQDTRFARAAARRIMGKESW